MRSRFSSNIPAANACQFVFYKIYQFRFNDVTNQVYIKVMNKPRAPKIH